MFRSKKIKNMLVILTSLALCLYSYAMFIQPFYIGGIKGLMKTWEDWQTFNSGMVAIVAAIITAIVAIRLDNSARQRKSVKIKESRNSERLRIKSELEESTRQRERELTAARVCLPEALDTIHTYVEKVSYDLFNIYNDKANHLDLHSKMQGISSIPSPTGIQQPFKECIQLADPEISKHLVYILNNLQVFKARLKIENERVSMLSIQEMLVDSLRFLYKIEGLFDFAREGKDVLICHQDPESYYRRLSRMSRQDLSFETEKDTRLETSINSAARRD